MNNDNDEAKKQNLPQSYRVEWLDETGQKRYKFYDELFTAEKAERWLIASGAYGVYLVAIIDEPKDDQSDQERDKQFGLA